jgi:hypothetical protein
MGYNHSEGKYLHLRLFLEGREVPIISANITESVNAPAMAEIQIPPTAAALQLRPRTSVLVFYYEPRSNEYCLGFIGEIIGVGYFKSDASRSISLQCMDHTSYWNIAYSYYFKANEPDLANLIRQVPIFLQARNVGLGDVGGQVQIASLLKESPKTPALSEIKGLPGGLIRLLEFLMGDFTTREGEFQPINSFFSYSALKNRLLQQITAMPNDDTAQSLFSIETLTDFLSNGVLSTKDIISYSDMVEYIIAYIFHQHFPIMRPKYESVRKQETVSGEGTANSFYSWADRISIALNPIIDAYEAGTVQGATEALAALMAPVDNSPNKNLFALAIEEAEAVLPIDRATTAIKHLENANLLCSSAFSRAQEGAPVSAFLPVLKEAKNNVDVLLEIRGTKATEYRGGRLHTRVFCPNIMFAAPPRCNVIFPEYYNRLDFSRSFTQEPTRMDLDVSTHSQKLGVASIAGIEHKYAPGITLPTNDSTALSNEGLLSKLLPHELHTGIIPKFSSIGNRLELQIAAGDEALSADEALQRIADFQFFMERLANRTMSVAGKFNPDLVVGLPCVVLDNANVDVKVDTVDDIIKYKDTLQQFLGVPSSIVHYISQDTGATTSATIAYVRSHRGEDDEIFRRVAKLAATAQYEKYLATALEEEESVAKATDISTLSAPIASGEAQTQEEVDTVYSNVADAVAAQEAARLAAEDAEQIRQDTIKFARFEDIIRPSWVSSKYDNAQIGDSFYQPILGISAITTAVSASEKSTFTGDLSIENAVDYLTLRYSKQNSTGMTTKFAESYTYRKVATKDEILDTNNGFLGPVFDLSKGLSPAKGTLPIELDKPECYQALAQAAAEIDSRAEKVSAVEAYIRSVSSRGLQN